MQIFLRKSIESDIPFISDSIQRHLREKLTFKDMNNTTFYAMMKAFIAFKHKRGCILVASAVDDPSQIYGYMIARDFIDFVAIDFIYVKEPVREMRIATELIKKLNINGRKVFNTILPENGRQKHMCKTVKAIYNPFLLNYQD